MQPKRKTIYTQGFKTFEHIQLNDFCKRHKPLENEACFMFLLDGAFQIRTPLKTVLLSENNGMLSKCDHYIYEEVNTTGEMIEVVGVYFHPQLIKQIVGSSNKLWKKPAYSAHIMATTDLFDAYKSSILYYMNQPKLFTEEMQLLKIKELLLILTQTEKAPSIHHFISSLFVPSDYDFQEIIEKNRYASLSVEQLANLCGQSITAFKKKFTTLYGTSPAQYLKKQKLQKAAKLLQLNNRRISDIAYDCGFESIATFNRLFQKEFGCSPTAFREKGK